MSVLHNILNTSKA